MKQLQPTHSHSDLAELLRAFAEGYLRRAGAADDTIDRLFAADKSTDKLAAWIVTRAPQCGDEYIDDCHLEF